MCPGKQHGHGSTRRKVLFHALSLTLVAVVLAQCVDQVRTYLSSYVVLGQTTETYPSLELPAISFCPGFRHGRVVERGWLRPSWHGHLAPPTREEDLPASAEESEAFWDGLNLRLEDFMAKVGSAIQNGTYRPYGAEELLHPAPDSCLRIEEIQTMQGRCFMLRSSCSIAHSMPVRLGFNLTGVFKGSLTLHLHHPRAVLGLNRDLWPQMVTDAELPSEATLQMEMFKEVSGEVRDGRSYETFFNCLDDAIAEDLSHLVAEKESVICNFPSFRSILAKNSTVEENLPPCLNTSEFTGAYWHLYMMLYRRHKEPHPCVRPSALTRYSLDVKRHFSPLIAPGLAEVVLYYVSSQVRVEEEHPLLGWTALVANVGGIVGMFLGWSLMDAARFVSEVLECLLSKMFEKKARDTSSNGADKF